MLRVCFAMLIAAVAIAQEAPPLSISVDVRLVNVAFIVRDEGGQLARDIAKEDIEIYEDGVKQEVKFFSRSGDLPLHLSLLVDASGSQNRFIAKHEKDLRAFLSRAVTPRDRVTLICFGNRIRIVGDMDGMRRFEKGDRDFPELDRDDTRREGTALFDAVYASAQRKSEGQRAERRAVILFSDGEDNASAHDLMDAIEAAENTDSVIYGVRYTDMRGGRLTARNRYGARELNRLAVETGGAGFDSAKEDVASALALVAEELRSMYEVGYTSSNSNAGAGFRKLEIRSKRPGLAVRSKRGYFAE